MEISLIFFFVSLKNRIHRGDKWKLLGMLYAQNTSGVYILPETSASMVLQRRDMRDGDGAAPLFNMIKNILSTFIRNAFILFRKKLIIEFSYTVGQHLFMTVKEWWWLERLNDILKRATQYGLMLHYERRTRRIMGLTRSELERRTKIDGGGHSQQSIKGIGMNDLAFVFNIYVGGMAVGFVIFCCEILHKKFRKKTV